MNVSFTTVILRPNKIIIIIIIIIIITITIIQNKM